MLDADSCIDASPTAVTTTTTTTILDDIVSIHTSSEKTSTTCSSRSSHTTSANSLPSSDIEDLDGEEGEGEEGGEGDETNWEDVDSTPSFSSNISSDIFMTIPKFPVHAICMEQCEDTLDDLINSEKEIVDEEWFAILMQVVMMLITYQKVFHLTHNDLHTNNIMYVKTKEKYLHYIFEGIHYKVPTYSHFSFLVVLRVV